MHTNSNIFENIYFTKSLSRPKYRKFKKYFWLLLMLLLLLLQLRKGVKQKRMKQGYKFTNATKAATGEMLVEEGSRQNYEIAKDTETTQEAWHTEAEKRQRDH